MSGRIYISTNSKLIFFAAVLFGATAYLQAAPRQNEAPQNQSPANEQSQNIAEAARRSREQAKNATKPSKVITDDDLDKKGVKPGQQGLTVDAPAKLETQPPTPDQVAAAATTPAAAATDPGAAPAAADDPEVAQLKEQLADAEKDADLGKRELALQQDSYLSNPDHEHDSAGKAKVDQPAATDCRQAAGYRPAENAAGRGARTAQDTAAARQAGYSASEYAGGAGESASALPLPQP